MKMSAMENDRINLNEEELDNVIDMFKSTSKLLKRPLSYSNLKDVHSRCKLIVGKLESAIGSLDQNRKISKYENEEIDNGPKEKKKKKDCSIQPDLKKKPNLDTITNGSTNVNNNVENEQNMSMEPVSAEEVKILFDLLSPVVGTNTWELTQLKVLLDEPFLPNNRKQYATARILEIVGNVFNQLLAEGKNQMSILEKVWRILNEDKNLTTAQKFCFDVFLVAIREKVLQGLLSDADSLDLKVVKDFSKIIQLSCISPADKMEITDKFSLLRNQLAEKVVTDSLKQYTYKEKVKIMSGLLEDPFMTEKSKVKLNLEINTQRNEYTEKLLNKEITAENDVKLLSKLKALSHETNKTLRQQIVVKIMQCEASVIRRNRKYRIEIREQLKSLPVEEILEFQGTNLEFIPGYGVAAEGYVRCVHVWKSQESQEEQIDLEK